MTQTVTDVEACVDAIIESVGHNIVFGMPLGLGKPTQLINALYARAQANADIKLTILTALSLEKPTASNELEARFLNPFVERVYGDCPDLNYILDLRKKRLPDNVKVCEFFFKPGSFMGNNIAQQEYISANYTHAARDVFANGCNVAAQTVAKRQDENGTRYSLSCNPDTGPELIELMKQRKAKEGTPYCVVAQVNQKLPYMVNDAEVDADTFDLILENEQFNTTLFSTPKLPVTTPDYMIGLHASSLIPDGGTLQIGIGALGDAIVYAAQLRQEDNSTYIKALEQSGSLEYSRDIIKQAGGTAPFEKGLYGATEMFVDGFLHLYNAGILKRKVYDFWALQQLVNEERCDPDNITPAVLNELEDLGVRVIRTKDFDVLQHHGFFNDQTQYDNGYIVAPDGTRVIANVADPNARSVLGAQCLGKELRRGIVAHGGFFLGPNDFYQGLNDMSEEARAEICMTGVDKINQLDLNPRLYRLQRNNARFINTGIMATLNGAVVSDGLEDGRVVSGVGGQYNFVATAHQLPTGRSILMIRSTREKDGLVSSNIVWNYGHCTIPRHLRDIIITEYGIAVLRSKTDSEVIKAMLNVTDSRFQNELLDIAKKAGKIEPDYQIPAQHRHNLPDRLEQTINSFRKEGLFGPYPLGCDFTDVELGLTKALKGIKARVGSSKFPWRAMLDARAVKQIPDGAKPYLERMQLTDPQGFKLKLVQKLLILELQETGTI